MTHIQLVDNATGAGKSLEDTLGLSTAATSAAPSSFAPTSLRGGIAIAEGPLPINPTLGTLAIDFNDNNTLKWWTGSGWIAAGSSSQ